MCTMFRYYVFTIITLTKINLRLNSQFANLRIKINQEIIKLVRHVTELNSFATGLFA